MNNDNQNFNIENKHIVSLASIMLLAPITYFMIKNKNLDIEEKDKKFVLGYIKYGLIIDLIILAYIIIGLFNYFNTISFLNIITNILGILGIVMIIIGIFLIFSEKKVFAGNIVEMEYKKIQKGNIDILLNYFPIYNFFLWYNTTPSKKDFWWLKESMIVCSFWIIINIISFSITLNLFIIILYIFRIISLIAGIDLLPDKNKEKLNYIFEKNPEEIFGYIKGSIIFLFEKLQNPGKELYNSAIVYVQKSKREYTNLISIKNKDIIAQYIILLIFLFLYIENINIIYKINSEIFGIIYIIPLILIIGRYVVMLPQNKLTNIPIIYEIVTLAKKLRNFLK